MYSRAPFIFFVLILVLIGLGSIYYRHVEMGVPLTAGEQIEIWQIEAQLEFTGNDAAVNAKLTLPTDINYTLLDETTASPAYGVHVLRDELKAEVIWSKRRVQGKQTLYYKASYKKAVNPGTEPAAQGSPELEVWPEPYQGSAQILLDDAFNKSGNQATLVLQLLDLLNSDHQHMAMLLSKYSKSEVLVQLMTMAEMPAMLVRGLVLEGGRRNQQLIPLIKAFINDAWQIINVDSATTLNDLPILVWQQDSPSLFDVEGGRNSKIFFSISKSSQSGLLEANRLINRDDVIDFGLYHLPIDQQNLFRGILLLPIGALVVVFLRVIIGLKCSGTFMPILIATSFIQTELVNGVIGFLLIVSIGLVIRSYLSHLNLLLVSRISAVVIVVIGIIILFTVLAFRLGLTEALTISFFPMIIMAWTIERMSILWEEEGGKEVLIQGGGSLIVAVIAYLMMDNVLIRHWAFNFLGVHCLIMAVILLMGQYTGYRLLELRRFKPMAED